MKTTEFNLSNCDLFLNFRPGMTMNIFFVNFLLILGKNISFFTILSKFELNKRCKMKLRIITKICS